MSIRSWFSSMLLHAPSRSQIEEKKTARVQRRWFLVFEFVVSLPVLYGRAGFWSTTKTPRAATWPTRTSLGASRYLLQLSKLTFLCFLFLLISLLTSPLSSRFLSCFHLAACFLKLSSRARVDASRVCCVSDLARNNRGISRLLPDTRARGSERYYAPTIPCGTDVVYMDLRFCTDLDGVGTRR